jgi:hypothetical protein
MSDHILGTWHLERFIIESVDGEARDWGRASRGMLIYTNDGYMSVSINKEVENKSSVEVENYFDSILFYSGTFMADKNVIRHQVTNASNPNRIGKELIRYSKLEGNTLTLTSPNESFGKAILTWRKSI